GLQVDPEHPTGTVQVSLRGGEPSYEIVADQAYDHVDGQRALASIPGHEDAILYHGSLALREWQSRETLAALRAAMQGGVLMDVNLRAPWWDRDSVHALMARATWIKLNEDELTALGTGESAEARVDNLLEHFDLDAVILTRGADGALVAAADGTRLSRPAPPVDGLVDTVGAGDAFSAVVLLGLIRGWGWDTILDRAARFAARV